MNRAVLIKKGAEASLYLADWHDRKVILKKRLAKEYRPRQLDTRIRAYRTVHEPQLLHEAKKAGVPTPIVFLVDVKDYTIIMEYIEGEQVKQLVGKLSKSKRRQLCFRIGASIGLLHEYGIVHGDLTTSNMILGRAGKVFFVDFGLGEKTSELEAKAVDLHLMKRALQSTHFQFAEECMSSVIDGYASKVGVKVSRRVCEKIGEIERRGRYVAERRENHGQE